VAYVGSEPDFEQLALDELKAAKNAETMGQRRAHLDQAAVYAALGQHNREMTLPAKKAE
jgi:hypothetical protein